MSTITKGSKSGQCGPDKSDAVMEERIRREVELIDQYIFKAAREMVAEPKKTVRKPK